ncbi:MAG TPA: metallopeptidase TldD-related protein [Bryobacteraceae bacterium]|nr:metallopeptidase TldD-related protein [Bryobacteraceae bacterium]
MKQRIALSVVAFACAVAALLAQPKPQPQTADPVLRAMHDEIERSRKLTVSSLEAPYFIQYLLDDAEVFDVTASLGGLLSVRGDHLREPEVQVRVGDYKFDNTNFAGMGFGSRYDMGRFPLENDYQVLRRYFWLSTDSAYKGAVETISRKRAALRNVEQNSSLDDLAHAEPVQLTRDFHPLAIDRDAWTNRARALSGVFAEFPAVKDSRVEVEASAGGWYMANSEGTEVKVPEDVVVLRVRAMAQASDGMSVRDTLIYQALDPARMPPAAEIERDVRATAAHVTNLAAAPKGEDYSGPVLFEDAASPQLFAQLLGANLAPSRRPEGGRGGSGPTSDLEGRMGARILPESFTVVDDPSQKEWRGRPLFGSYEVDREGVPAKPLRVVEKGVLKSYLLTRQPIRGFSGSNGRARMDNAFGASSAGISNLFVSSTETVPAGDMKKKLIELIQQRSKPYGIVVRKFDFPAAAPTEELRRIMSSAQGTIHPLSAPTLVYKVFPDGHEELIRGMRFHGANARSLKDILVAGDDGIVFDFMNSAAPFALIGAGGFTAESCVVAPSIIIDDLELQPVDDEQPKLPLVTAPALAH